MISNTSFVLKGTGWYVTDYKGANACTAGDNGKSHHGDKPAGEAPACKATGKGASCSSCPSAAASGSTASSASS